MNWMKRDERFSIKIILDANVLVSAVFGGLPAKAVEKAMGAEVWTSPEIRRELLNLSQRLSARLTLKQYLAWNNDYLPLLSRMQVARVRRNVSLCRDPGDDIYLSLAWTVAADYLVTGDKDLLSISLERLRASGLGKLAILTPKDFLGRK